MANKRRASALAGRQSSGRYEEPQNIDSRLRVSTFEDIADSEDEFYINRDKISFDEGPAQKKQRKGKEEGMFTLRLTQASKGIGIS